MHATKPGLFFDTSDAIGPKNICIVLGPMESKEEK